MLSPYIIRSVAPGAICSYPRGERIVECLTDRGTAERLANLYNSFVGVPGVAYRVDEFDDSTEAPIPTDW